MIAKSRYIPVEPVTAQVGGFSTQGDRGWFSPAQEWGVPSVPLPQSGMGARTPVIRVTAIQKPAQTMFPRTIPRKKGRRRR